MPELIDISGLDAFAKVLSDVVNSGNKAMLNDLMVGFRQGVLEEGRKLVKEAGLPSEEKDLDDLADDLGEEFRDALQEETDKRDALETRRLAAAQRVQEQFLKRIQSEERVRKFSFQGDIGEKAVQSLAKKIAAPEKVGGAIEKTLGPRAYKRYIEKSEENVKRMLSKGVDIDELLMNAEDLVRARVTLLYDIAQTKKLSKKKLDLMIEQLIKSTELEIVAAEEMVKKKEVYGRAIDRAAEALGNVPLIGKALSKGFERFANDPVVKAKFLEKFPKLVPTAGAETKAGVGTALMSGLKITAGLAALAALSTVLYQIVQRFGRLLTSSLNFNSELVRSAGLTSRLAKTLEPAVQNFANFQTNAELFGGIVEAKQAAIEASGALLTQLGGFSGLSKDAIETTALLAKRMGIGTEGAARMVVAWRRTLGLASNDTLSLVANLRAGSEKYGLSLTQLLEDSATNAGLLAVHSKNTAAGIANAVINARRLGTTIESQARTAEKFLSFEDALNNAFTIQFITGQKLNVQSLYAKANYGDSLGIQNQLIDAYGKALRTQKLSRYEQQAFAQAIGMSLEELQTTLIRRREEGELVRELNKSYGIVALSGKGAAAAFEFQKSALRELKLEMSPQDITKAAIEARAAEIQAASEASRVEITNMAKLIGVSEAMGPTELFLGKISVQLDKISKFLVDRAGPLIMSGLNSMNNLLDYFTGPGEEEFKEVESFAKSQGFNILDIKSVPQKEEYLKRLYRDYSLMQQGYMTKGELKENWRNINAAFQSGVGNYANEVYRTPAPQFPGAGWTSLNPVMAAKPQGVNLRPQLPPHMLNKETPAVPALIARPTPEAAQSQQPSFPSTIEVNLIVDSRKLAKQNVDLLHSTP